MKYTPKNVFIWFYYIMVILKPLSVKTDMGTLTSKPVYGNLKTLISRYKRKTWNTNFQILCCCEYIELITCH